jgi:FkbM family methyltransferase
MSAASRVKGVIQAAARRFGYQIRRADRDRSMAAVLGRLAPRHPIRTVIDVGASDGRWSLEAMKAYPQASYLLFEAQSAPHGDALRQLSASDPRVHAVLAAAGHRSGTIHFDASDPWGGVASEEPTGAQDLEVPVTTIDREVDRLGLPPPYLLKLDTHGFEVPILEGASRTLERAAVLVIEAYNFQIRPEALRFDALCRYLDERGFRTVDLVDPLWRPLDGSLWQFDLVFVRSDAPEFESAAYA